MLCVNLDNFFDKHRGKTFVTNEGVQELHNGVIIEHPKTFNQLILRTGWKLTTRTIHAEEPYC
jgi:hypothetical protein